MSVWEPWDADEDEIVDLRVIREAIPPTMRPALMTWMYERLTNGYARTTAPMINALQTALRIDLGLSEDFVETAFLVRRIESQGDKFVLRVVDFLLSAFETPNGFNAPPGAVTALKWHLDTSMSSVQITSINRVYRLAHRLPDGVEEAMQVSIDAGAQNAGQHLAKAIRQAQSLEPDSSLIMTESIRAVESAAGPVVLPRDKQHRLGKIVQALKDKPGWTLVFDRRDDAVPDHRSVVIGMIETLAFAQRDRHAGAAPTSQQAMAHVMLAATLVGWFATGAVQMNEG